MNNREHKWIEDRLAPGATPEPPEGLLERIQDEIPEHLQLVSEPEPRKAGGWKVQLLAASVALAIVSAGVVYQVSLRSPSLQEQVARDAIEATRKGVEVPNSVSVVEPKAAELEAIAADVVAVEGLASAVTERERDLQKIQPKRKEVGPSQGNEALALREPGLKDDQAARRGQDADRGSQSLEVDVENGTAGKSEFFGELRPLEESAPERQESKKERSADSGLRALGYLNGPVRQDAPAAPSTGGTAEPNDAPYGDMFFRTYGTNPFIDTEDDNLSTFGLDVDTGSFTLARSYLDRGHLPPPEAIRVEEFVNYFDYHDPAPRRGEFTLIAEGGPSPFADGPRYQLVRFAVKAREVRSDRRPPAALIFVVDVSGSMGRENRIELVKRSLHLLLDELNAEDRIGLVIYGSRGEVILEPTRSKEAIRRAIDRLRPGGSTNAEEGLDLAYDLARRNYREGDINRIILCSDGVANVGRTGPESILERVRREADEGIELTTVGFGMGNYNDVLMEQLADQGDGSYAYVDTFDEARRIFVENLTGTLQTIAADAKAQVEFNPETVSRYRLLGYENRDIADERFRDDTVDAGEIGAGHSVTALYEIKLHEGVGNRQPLATLRLRYRSKATDAIVETAIEIRKRDLAHSWERSSVALRLSSLAAEFAEILRGSYWAKDSDLDELHRRLRPVADRLAGDEEVEDLLYLVGTARRLSDRNPARFEE